jgi:hypothetical protein
MMLAAIKDWHQTLNWKLGYGRGKEAAHTVARGGSVKSYTHWHICRGKRPPTEAAYWTVIVNVSTRVGSPSYFTSMVKLSVPRNPGADV